MTRLNIARVAACIQMLGSRSMPISDVKIVECLKAWMEVSELSRGDSISLEEGFCDWEFQERVMAEMLAH